MGRPLKKNFFGPDSNEGKQIILDAAWIPGKGSADVSNIWILRQSGVGKYVITDGTTSGICQLVDDVPDDEGQCTIEVVTHDGGIEYAKRIHANHVLTFDGNTYIWMTDEPPSPRYAEIHAE